MDRLYQDDGASLKDCSGVAELAAEDAMDAAREGDLMKAYLLAGIAVKYSERHRSGELMDTIVALALANPSTYPSLACRSLRAR